MKNRLLTKALALLCLFAIANISKAQELDALQAALIVQQTMVDAIAKSEASVVAVARVSRARLTRDEAGDPMSPDFIPNGYGAGVVIDADGYILTCYHVIRDVEDYQFYVWSQKRPFRASVVAADPWSDLAILKIDAPKLTPIKYGATDDLKKGQIVIALGNPYAIARDGEASASWGIISNLRRQVKPRSEWYRPKLGKESLHYHGTLIHCDARMNFGASGGALVNLRGEMIGLTTALAALDGYDNSGGFAMPIDETMKRAINELKQGKSPEFGFLGIAPRDLPSSDLARGEFGAIVSSVVTNTPAQIGGLRAEDHITHLNERPVHSSNDLVRDLSSLPAGATARFRVNRTDSRGRTSEIRLSILLSKKYVDALRPTIAPNDPVAWRGMKVDSATAIPPAVLSDRSFDIDPDGCVAVTEVAADSPAWKAGVRPWTFITHVDKRRVASPKEFYELARKGRGEVDLRESSQSGEAVRQVPTE